MFKEKCRIIEGEERKLMKKSRKIYKKNKIKNR